MKFFRVKIGEQGPVVEPFLAWQRMDGTAFVSVGGLSMSYLTVANDLAPASERSGQVTEGDFRLSDRGGLEIIAGDPADDRAFVLIPTGAYEFDRVNEHSPHQPRDRMCARVVVVNPGETLKAIPRARTIAEMDRAITMALSYRGAGELRFEPAAGVATDERPNGARMQTFDKPDTCLAC